MKPEKKINFFITSDTFPSISTTGNSCSLHCKHCEGKLLQHLIPAATCEELERKALLLYSRGAKGLLLTGGCDKRGRVNIKNLIPAIRNLKKRTDLIIIAHTGFISRDEAELLRGSGLDGIGFDVVGDMNTAEEIYGLSICESTYLDSLSAIHDSGLLVFPHVCAGIHFGKLKGEFRALEIIRSIIPATIIITCLMPVAGTPFEHIKPSPSDVEKVIKKAIEMFPCTPVVLGCAHSNGKDRAEIEERSLLCGVSGIASPTIRTIELARKEGYAIEFYGSCCGLIPEERMKTESFKFHGDLYRFRD